MKVTCEPKHIRTVNSDKTSKLAYASITLDDAFVVHGLSIINGENAAENTATNTAPDYGNAPTPTDADAPPENSDYDMPEPF
mgnify:CR=1 FL=1